MSSHAEEHHGHGEHEGAHGTLGSYLIGFVLSVILTVIPFWLVMDGTILDKNMTVMAIMALAAVQVVVHMIFFLHMNGRAEGGWTMLSLIFTIIVVVIMLAGSLWVMYHLNTNMMPIHDPSRLP
ncbi:cytochrome o ubiquinol oxidase subunit IV [Azospirillum brasilense]|uniref:cytochrome o ubiquinol oxidase subunit IV n=1 Tax=Azospirillum brasilense TaxID=192 RepID=UPI000E6A32AA|nr:cytochrome o ubiquinol oxidase subunit IV [Azospirillum brasilense]NUB25895.1 cytochrome o ubiquinol oxidase subunit IV [Azospirillum brasilense]NUB31302.1 cytochrome o ubiquinol oxidase subunit IV [Azospirillum brasilense]RIW06533.1 cytochrome o ubiquinol oxidase subunit IV [Azospirillum brasilense]